MTMCTEAGCGGTIAADGYCDTCGAKPATNRAGSTPAGSTPAGSGIPSPAGPGAGGAASGDTCPEPGCGGTIASDGYCDTCGMAPTSRPSPAPASPGVGTTPPAPPGAGPTPSGAIPSIAAPESPDVSARMATAGGDTAHSRRTVTSTRNTSARTGIGRGLVTVAPTPVGDPASAVMGPDRVKAVLGEVPEEDRHCSSCGHPVGRAAGDRPGRVKGFCGSCRTPFDFVTNEPALAAGELVAGQYQILGPLAHGGMGWIYLGQDKAVSDRWVVLKGLLNESDPDAALAAVAERQFLAQIDHANIVNIYNFVTHRGAGYIVMEMVGGESLNAKLKRRRATSGGAPSPLPPTEAIAYILGILPAFSYLHEHGLVYNDLKPANIMAVGDGVKLIDVGAVMRIDDHDAAIFGTQGFQAPEVATAGPSVASDLYTVGRTLAVLLLVFVFHDGPYLYALPDRSREPLFARWESLHRFLLRACAYHPDDRFQSAGEMAQQLTGVLRQMVAIEEGRPRAHTSTLFEGDRLPGLLGTSDHYDVARPDWRVVPAARIDDEDPAAAFLDALPAGDPVRAGTLIDAGVEAGQVALSPEIDLHRAWLAVAAERDPLPFLAEVELANPWEWRVVWYRSIRQLQTGRPAEAAEGFSRVWTELPGESAPKLGVALAAEMAGQYERAAEVYDLLISADPSYVSAAFGLARCRYHQGNAAAVVEAYNRVPASSAAHYDAQVATAQTLVTGGRTGQPSAEELQAASATIERLQLDQSERAELSAEVYERALEAVGNGTLTPGLTLLGRPVDEQSLREGLEETYRTLARLASTEEERIDMVDRANQIRPRSLL